MRPTAEVRPGCRAMPCAMTSPRSANAVTVASVRPTPVPPTIRSRSQALPSSAAAIDAASRAAAVDRHDFGTGARAALRDQIRRDAAAGNIDDAQPRTANAQSLQSGGARHQEIARPHAPPGLRDETACRDIAAGPAHALPRNRLRQHLRHRPGQIDGIGIEHAIASLGNRLAGLDPDRRRRQRQRRIGGRADEIARAERIAVDRGDVARRISLRAAASRRRCNAAPPTSGSSTGATGSTPCSRASSATSSGVSEVGRRCGEVMARLCPEIGPEINRTGYRSQVKPFLRPR